MTDIEMIKLSGHLNLPKESLCLLSFLMIISKKKIFYYQIVVALPLMDKVITCLAMIETIYCCDLSRFPDTALFSAHIISANGEILAPYQQLSSNNSFMICNQHQILQTLLHERTNFQAVCFDFKQKIIDDCLVGRYQLKPDDLCHIFKEANHFLGAELGKIADDILHYKLGSSTSELFYEIKAKEWLSSIINNYYTTQNDQEISQEDSVVLENVRHYINDHLMATIPQDLLAKIDMMSKTKLKTAFKTKYHMTITEYIQQNVVWH